jgi:hypothetical protein
LDRGRRGRTSRRGGGLGGRLRLCALAVNGKTKAASAAVSIHRLLCIRTPPRRRGLCVLPTHIPIAAYAGCRAGFTALPKELGELRHRATQIQCLPRSP